MSILPMVGVAFAALIVAPVAAASSMQPPMNNFNYAYYNCDSGGAFMISYDSDRPKKATMTTSNNNKRYLLTRTPSASGAQFSGGAAKFWTDGKAVVVEGTEKPYRNCKIKSN